jgi:hypothetical protein
MWGRSFISGAGGWYLAGYRTPTGRILVVDDSTIYGFGEAPLRFVGTPKAYHLFACAREPKIINPNPKQPPRKLGTSIFGKVFPTRLEYSWSHSAPFIARAMVLADQALFAAGPPAMVDETEVYQRYGDPAVQAKIAEQAAAFEGRKGALLMAVSRADGKRTSAYRLASPPVFDGMVAAGGRLFLAAMDGKVLCLGGGDGQALPPAPNAALGPPPDAASPVSGAAAGRIQETLSHPDFQAVASVRITPSDLGYRMTSVPRAAGLALKKLAAPITRRAEFRVKVRPSPDSAPDKPGNGFIAFGNAPEDARLVKCGFRISGKCLTIVQGPLAAGRAASKKADLKSNEVMEMQVAVDLAAQKVKLTLKGETLEAPLSPKLDVVTWVGFCLTSVTTDFGPLEISGE